MTSANETPAEVQEAEDAYGPRVALLKGLAQALEQHTRDILDLVPRIDRVSFRVKDPASFGRKSVSRDKKTGVRKYTHPLQEIEDQVAGRVLVFFRRDIGTVVERLKKRFHRVEQSRKSPSAHDAFAYESEHLVFIIPPHVLPSGWKDIAGPPTTFEMQVRTLFMHAWAEPQHDIEYKAQAELTDQERRSLAWAASGAWGGDAIFEQVLDSIESRVARNVANDTE